MLGNGNDMLIFPDAVTPAKTGVSCRMAIRRETPARAGMTD